MNQDRRLTMPQSSTVADCRARICSSGKCGIEKSLLLRLLILRQIPKPQASVTVPKRHDSQIGDISPQPIQASATSKALPTVAGLHNRAFGKAFLTLNAEQQKHVKAIYFEIYGLITAPNFALSVIKSQYNGL